MLTVFQLAKWIKRCNPRHDPRVCARAWAKRIEGGAAKSCIPKKKLRAAGLLPPVNHENQTTNRASASASNPA